MFFNSGYMNVTSDFDIWSLSMRYMYVHMKYVGFFLQETPELLVIEA